MKRSILITLTAAAALTGAVTTQVRTESTPDIQTTTFETPQGRIQVYAPAARSSFSGLVVAEPAGKTEHERQANAAALNGYVIEMDGQRAKAGAGVFRYALPAAGAVTGMILLKNSANRQVASGPMGQWDPGSPYPEYYPRWNVIKKDRRMVQTGKPLTVPGSFDADLANTQAQVGGSAARVLVETPRGAVIEAPSGVTGPAEAMVREGSQTYHQPVTVVDVRLSAPKTTLNRGEQTSLNVHVRGLEALESPAELRLVNHSPSTLRMGSSDVEAITIQPAQVQAGGVYQTARTLTGVTPGAFSITAEVANPMTCAVDPCQDLVDALKAAGDDATAKETEARTKIVKAGELATLAGKARLGGPSAWEAEAAKHEAAAKTADADATKKAKRGADKAAEKAREAADAERAAAKECRDTAKALRDNLVPDDDPKTPNKENAEAARKLEGDAQRLRDEATILEKEAGKLRDKERNLRKELENCRKEEKDSEKK